MWKEVCKACLQDFECSRILFHIQNIDKQKETELRVKVSVPFRSSISILYSSSFFFTPSEERACFKCPNVSILLKLIPTLTAV
jgi:hypothetical protein